MQIKSKELTLYIREVLRGIKEGLEGEWELRDAVEFELAVTNLRAREGGIKIHVIGLGGKRHKEDVSKIKFKVYPRKKG